MRTGVILHPMVECVRILQCVYVSGLGRGEPPQGQAVKCSNDMPMHSTMLGVLGGSFGGLEVSWGAWVGPGRFGGALGRRWRRSFFVFSGKLGMNLAMVQ